MGEIISVLEFSVHSAIPEPSASGFEPLTEWTDRSVRVMFEPIP
jgi:hypothetical protein